jgi:hypothetical protein
MNATVIHPSDIDWRFRQRIHPNVAGNGKLAAKLGGAMSL